MSNEPRFTEPQIREVFERAAAESRQPAPSPAGEGLTLSELREIGVSAGLPPEAVLAAAYAVAHGEPREGRETMVGVPVAVSRSAVLTAPPEDLLWDQLVADLRETFGGRGRVEHRGTVRTWRKGSLRVTLEPAGTGSRLRLRAHRRSDTPGLLGLGAVSLVLAPVMILLSLAAGSDFTGGFAVAAVALACAGVLDLGLVTTRQHAWARRRERELEDVVHRAVRRAGGEGDGTQEPDPLAPLRAAPAETDPAVSSPGSLLDETSDDPLPGGGAGRRRSRSR